MTNVVGSALIDHLWQSTLFAALLACVTLLFRANSARIRCLLWSAASAKFLIPFSPLIALGAHVPWPAETNGAPLPGLLNAAGHVVATVAVLGTKPLVTAATPSAAGIATLTALGLGSAWLIGSLALAIRWFRRWRVVRQALRGAVDAGFAFVIPVRWSSTQLEPALLGIRRPVLLLPKGLDQVLPPEQMQAVLAHERCHLAWRDNLAATVHMLVETLFWFHPLVWWIGARMIEERERACDEQVLAQGHAAQSYAEGILKVCEHYLQCPLNSAAAIGGADLRDRIESIMKNTVIERVGAVGKLALSGVACAAIAIPLVVGIATSPHGAVFAATTESATTLAQNVSVELAPPPPAMQPSGGYKIFGLMMPDGKRLRSVFSLRSTIAQLYEVDESQVVGLDLSKYPLYQVTIDDPWPVGDNASGDERMELYKRMTGDLPSLTREILTRHFGLAARREEREMDGYVLTVGIGGSKLQPDTNAPHWKEGAGAVPGELIVTQMPVATIIRVLERSLDRPVLDQTGLGGTYDYKWTWPVPASGMAVDPNVMAKSLDQELGLHLEARRITVDVINVLGLKSPQQILASR